MSTIEAVRVLLSFFQGESVPYKEIYKAFRTLLDAVFVNDEVADFTEVKNAIQQEADLIQDRVTSPGFELLKPILLKLLLKLLS